jgi:hypothetical protein
VLGRASAALSWLMGGDDCRAVALQVWTIATHVEDVAPDEMKKRMEAFTRQQTNKRPATS